MRDQHLRVRPLAFSDIPFAMSLKECAGWNQTSGDWEAFLRLRPHGCFLAEWAGEPAGTVTTVAHDCIGWIGMLLVKPEVRGRGIGGRLLDAATESLSSSSVAKLDATPAGRQVYEARGFSEEQTLERHVLDQCTTHAFAMRAGMESSARITPLEPRDLAAVSELDAAAFGANRGGVIEEWLRGAPEYAFVARSGATIDGYCLGRHGSRREHVGPIVAGSLDVARGLLRETLREMGQRPAMLDAFVLRENSEWRRLLGSLGFLVERGFTRMRLGPARPTGHVGLQWAIAGPEVG